MPAPAHDQNVHEDHGVLARVEAVCGPAAVLALSSAFGGREIYVPRLPESISETHPLAVALGLACARRVASEFGHGRLVVPLGALNTASRRRRAVVSLKREEKRSNGYIAQALGIHLRTVEKIVAAAGLTDQTQPGLFD